MSKNPGKSTGKRRPRWDEHERTWVHPSMQGRKKLDELEAKGLVKRDSKGRITGIHMKDEGPTLDG